MPSNFKALAGASGGEPTDANFKNVTLLLHGDGSNGAQNNTFLDSSTNNFTITRNGNTTQGSFSPYGSNWSNYFDGAGDYLTVPANTAFAFGTGDFTVEFWFNAASYRTSGPYYDCFLALGNFANSPYFRINQDGRLTAGITATNEYYTTSTVTLNRWTHFAVTRQGSTVRLFVNGVLETTQTNSTNLLNTTDVTVGTSAWQAANETFTGYLSNVRVLKGTALYTSTFTPSTTPLTAITNTSLLTCAYNRFRDASTNNFTITRFGDVKVTNFAPFAPSAAYSTSVNGGSAYFDGDGDYLSIPNNAAFSYGTGDFTVEAWVYKTATSGDRAVLDSYTAGSGGGTFGFLINNTQINAYQTNVATYTFTYTVPNNSWNHIAFVRTGGNLICYVNGTSIGSQANSANFVSASTIDIGRNAGSGGSQWIGYISNLRIVKGTAVYTAAFTPPSSPVTAITNTSLLINAANAAIFDNSMKNDLETVGNAQISTSVKKFGTGSMAFDGSGDRLSMPATAENRINVDGNFTIEFWAYFNSVASNQRLIAWDDNSTNFVIALYTNTSGNLAYYLSSNGVNWNIAQAISMGSISINTWYHIALVRNGSTFTPYINGVAGTTTTSSATLATSGFPFIIGDTGNAVSPFNGYIDDFRITKGVARYTANFTAPTAPFPNK